MLNQEQQLVFDNCMDFLESPESFFVLSAPAGTGKSFLINYIAQHLVTLNKAVYVTATTNKAVAVLANSIPNVKTIHSLLKLRVNYNEVTGKQSLTGDITKAYYLYNSVVIVDECSYIDYELFNLLQSIPEVKWIFVGDSCQIPPVNCKLSPVFTLGKLNTLSTLVRQAENQELQEVSNYFRKVVNHPDVKMLMKSFTLPNFGKSVELITNSQQLSEVLDTYFKEPNRSCRILAYTNSTVTTYSNYITTVLRQSKIPYVIGGNYVINSAVLDSNENIIFNTEQEITLIDINPEVQIDPLSQVAYYKAIARSDTGTYTIDIVASTDQYKTILKHLYKEATRGVISFKQYYTIKNHFAVLRLFEVSTVHKAQGSTLDTVIIDLDDIRTNHKYEELARIIYVAFTRAKKKIYVKFNPSSK